MTSKRMDFRWTGMVGPILLMLLWPQSVKGQDWFGGIYMSARLGGLVSHPLRVQAPARAQRKLIKLNTRVGFSASAALGVWVDFLPSSRLRTELEVGYQSYALGGRTDARRLEIRRGEISSQTFLWNNYWSFLPRSSRHQLWLGSGLGAVRSKRSYGDSIKDYYYFPYSWHLGLSGSVGYDYRLSAQLGIGVSYRYLYVFAPSRLQQSQLRIAVSYGF